MKHKLLGIYTTLTMSIFAIGAGSVFADVGFSTSVSYSTASDLSGSIGETSDSAIGESFATLSFAGPGPLGGNFDFSGSATAAIGELGVAGSLTLSDYPVGSYVAIYTPGTHYVPNTAIASSQVNDTVRIVGPDPTYNVQFTFTLTGTVLASGTSTFVPWVVPNVVFSSDDYNSRDYQVVIPEDGPHFSVVTVTAHDVPSNVDLTLSQSVDLYLIAQDSHYEVEYDPYETGEFDPEDWLFVPDMSDPYSISLNADFANTLVLDTMALLDANGELAVGKFVSANGVIYPVDSRVPEPSTAAVMIGFCTAWLLARRGVRARA